MGVGVVCGPQLGARATVHWKEQYFNNHHNITYFLECITALNLQLGAGVACVAALRVLIFFGSLEGRGQYTNSASTPTRMFFSSERFREVFRMRTKEDFTNHEILVAQTATGRDAGMERNWVYT
eukprot:1167538-Prorocentrum_minimum.AAC.3